VNTPTQAERCPLLPSSTSGHPLMTEKAGRQAQDSRDSVIVYEWCAVRGLYLDNRALRSL